MARKKAISLWKSKIKYSKQKFKNLEYSLNNLFQKFKENIIRLNKDSFIDCYIKAIIAESNYYYYSKLLRYDLLKASPETISKINLKYILELYNNILNDLCLNNKNEVDINELNKTLKDLEIKQINEELIINNQDLEKIKLNIKEILNKLENLVKLFYEKYKIDINKFKKLKFKYYYDKFENEIAPPLNMINNSNEHEKNITIDNMLKNENIKIDILKNDIIKNLDTITSKVKTLLKKVFY